MASLLARASLVIKGSIGIEKPLLELQSEPSLYNKLRVPVESRELSISRMALLTPPLPPSSQVLARFLLIPELCKFKLGEGELKL